MIELDVTRFYLVVILACGISFCSGMLFMGENMTVKYQNSVNTIVTGYQDTISSLQMRSFNMETKLRNTIELQGKMCTDYMISMYDDMCDENVKKDQYEFLEDLR